MACPSIGSHQRQRCAAKGKALGAANRRGGAGPRGGCVRERERGVWGPWNLETGTDGHCCLLEGHRPWHVIAFLLATRRQTREQQQGHVYIMDIESGPLALPEFHICRTFAATNPWHGACKNQGNRRFWPSFKPPKISGQQVPVDAASAVTRVRCAHKICVEKC